MNRLSIAALFLLTAIGCSEPAGLPETVPPVEGSYAFVDVNVVDIENGIVTAGHTVLVSNGRITRVGATDDVATPQGATVIDSEGKYLAPGLADMHAHPMTERDLHAYITSGITLIRSMWGEPAVLALREGVAAGELLGPRIFTGGRIVDGEPVIHYGSERVLTEEEAEAVVARHKAAGYDFIKVYSNLSVEAFDAIVAAAKRHGIPVEGHIPSAVPTTHAFANMRAAEHLIGIEEATLADGANIVKRWNPTFPAHAASLGRGETSLSEQYDDEKLAAIAAAARDSGIWTVPTLVTIRGTAMSPEAVARQQARPEYAYVDYTVKSFWNLSAMFRTGWTEDSYRGAEMLFEHELSQVKALHDAGARILAGTDAQNPWAMTGDGMVDELELLVRAGLSNLDALRAATTSPAAYMQETGTSGVVAEGARADVVLLSANPLEDVAAYRAIEGVMSGQTWLDRAALDGLLDGMLAANTKKEAFFADAQPWPLQEGEQALIEAQFVVRQGEQVLGTERIASTINATGTPGVIGQTYAADGSHRDLRGGAGEQAPLLTNTAMDWLVIGPTLAGLNDGETRALPVRVTQGDGEIVTANLTVTRQPSEVLVGHFYFTGSNRHDVRLQAPGIDRSMQVWLGGGFYQGWPVKLVLDPDGESSVEYQRIL